VGRPPSDGRRRINLSASDRQLSYRPGSRKLAHARALALDAATTHHPLCYVAKVSELHTLVDILHAADGHRTAVILPDTGLSVTYDDLRRRPGAA